MQNQNLTQAIRLPRAKIVLLLVGLAITTILPAFIHNQWITGPIINATLLIATVVIGPMEAVMLGLMPSTVALATGLLPLPLAPMVPFIMIGNAILIATFYYLRQTSFWGGIGLAAFLKFGFLHLSVIWIMSRLLDSALTMKLATMMSWPQLISALIGGVIAYPVLKNIKN